MYACFYIDSGRILDLDYVLETSYSLSSPMTVNCRQQISKILIFFQVMTRTNRENNNILLNMFIQTIIIRFNAKE